MVNLVVRNVIKTCPFKSVFLNTNVRIGDNKDADLQQSTKIVVSASRGLKNDVEKVNKYCMGNFFNI